MEKQKNVIWSNRQDYIDSIYSELVTNGSEFWDEWFERNGDDYDDMNDAYTALENDAYDEAVRLCEDYLDDERANLNIDTHSDIIAIADLGLWDGRRMGYKMIGSSNIADCLYTDRGMEDVEWYCDAYNFKARMWHHDGVNEILYRARKDGISEMQWDDFLYKIYSGKMTKQDIHRYTRSLQPDIAKVYGWKYRVYPKTNYWDKVKFAGAKDTIQKAA